MSSTRVTGGTLLPTRQALTVGYALVMGVAERHSCTVRVSAVGQRVKVVSGHAIEGRKTTGHSATTAGLRERALVEPGRLPSAAASRVEA
jgi:hypothetical protein